MIHENIPYIHKYNIIDSEDFDGTVQFVTFPADEHGPLITSVSAFIPINDDAKDEGEQNFVLYMEVHMATNNLLITDLRNVSLGRILDDDSKFNNNY